MAARLWLQTTRRLLWPRACNRWLGNRLPHNRCRVLRVASGAAERVACAEWRDVCAEWLVAHAER